MDVSKAVAHLLHWTYMPWASLPVTQTVVLVTFAKVSLRSEATIEGKVIDRGDAN